MIKQFIVISILRLHVFACDILSDAVLITVITVVDGDLSCVYLSPDYSTFSHRVYRSVVRHVPFNTNGLC